MLTFMAHLLTADAKYKLVHALDAAAGLAQLQSRRRRLGSIMCSTSLIALQHALCPGRWQDVIIVATGELEAVSVIMHTFCLSHAGTGLLAGCIHMHLVCACEIPALLPRRSFLCVLSPLLRAPFQSKGVLCVYSVCVSEERAMVCNPLQSQVDCLRGRHSKGVFQERLWDTYSFTVASLTAVCHWEVAGL